LKNGKCKRSKENSDEKEEIEKQTWTGIEKK
jgi:hypothetical protein